MSCDDVQAILSAYLDQELDPEAQQAILQHLDHCPACAALLKAYQEMDQELAGLAQPVPEGFTDRVMAALPKQEQPRKHRFAYGGFTALGAVAAVLILSVAAGWITLPGMGRASDTDSAVQMEASIAAEEALPAAEPTAPMAKADDQDTAAETESSANSATLYAAQWQDGAAAADSEPAEAVCETTAETAPEEEPCAVEETAAATAEAAPTEDFCPAEPVEAECAIEAAAPASGAAGTSELALGDLAPAFTVTIPHAFDQTLPEELLCLSFITLADGTQYCDMSRSALEALLQTLDGQLDLVITDEADSELGRLILEP